MSVRPGTWAIVPPRRHSRQAVTDLALMPAAYTDARARIRQQCASDDFEIDRVTVERVAGVPKLRIRFRPTPETTR